MKGTATSVGLGSGTLLIWLWSAYAVPRGQPDMPIEVAGILAATMVKIVDKIGDAITNWLERK